MSDSLEVVARTTTGSRESRRLRREWVRLHVKRISALEADVVMFGGLIDKARAKGLYPDEMDIEMLYLTKKALEEERA